VVSRNIAFSCLVLETIFAVPRDEVLEHITDGGEDRGIDFILIDHRNRRINISTCKTVTHHRSMKKNFPGEEIDKIISFVDDLLTGRDDLLNTCNGKLCAKVREIWDIFDNETYAIAVHLFSNQTTLTREARDRLAIALERHDIALYEYGLFELSHGVVKATKPRFQKKLSPATEAALTARENGRRAIVTTVTLNDLAAFLTEEDTFDQRLIWLNTSVRPCRRLLVPQFGDHNRLRPNYLTGDGPPSYPYGEPSNRQRVSDSHGCSRGCHDDSSRP
jgi:hypothetical protein